MTFTEIYQKLYTFMGFKLFAIGDTAIGFGDILVFILILFAFLVISKTLSRLLSVRVLASMPMEDGTKYVLRRITEYVLIIVGTVVAFQTIGINLSGLAVIFGLLSVGIGFGLQNVASNFISGLILLFERPIRVGDRITVGDTEGDVEEIDMRSTTVRSLNNISIIVPNSDFISSKVINWSHGDQKVRLDISVGVSYSSDLDLVLKSLEEVALENSEILKMPKPEVLLVEFGDSSWNMELRVWIPDPKRWWQVRSDINCAIVRKFRSNDIEIPFPQRDLHVRSTTAIPLINETE
jgi:small-conductance mechanosensitive channel